MKRLLLITTSYPIHPRLIKIGEMLKRTSKYSELIYFSFNFENKKNNNKYNNEIILSYKTNIKYFKYFIGLKELLYVSKKNNINSFVCRGVLSLFLLKILFISKKVYYDIPDLLENKKYLNILEKFLLKKTNYIFLASRFFYKYYEKYFQKIIILENYPSKYTYKLDFKTKFNYSSKNKILSFIGIIRYIDVLKNLVDSVKDKEIDLLFFGSGTSEEELKNYCKKNKINNVHFFGEYNYMELYKFYNISDFVWAAYDYRIDNVKYAISNKFYENILYEKIGIYSKFTELGSYVENNQIGLTIDCFNKEEMEKLINSLINNNYLNIMDNIKKYKNTKKLFWEDQIEELNKLREEK